MDVPYEILYGGHSKKELDKELFPTLNEIISFPTLIVLDKNQELVKIHTGFNGPATSEFASFNSDMNQLLDSLISK